MSEKPAAPVVADPDEMLTLYSPHRRPIHVPGLAMLIPGSNPVRAAAWDKVKDQANVKELGLREERLPAHTAGRDEASAVALVNSTLDIKRLESMKASETRPSVLAAIGVQIQKLFVPPKQAPDMRTPIERAISLGAPTSEQAVPVAPAAADAPKSADKSDGDRRRK